MKTKSTPKTEPVESESRKIFKANLPQFKCTVRGNVVAEGETFTSKAGQEYYAFRMAYTRIRNDVKTTMFIKVIQNLEGFQQQVNKGDYVQVSGNYSDELGTYKDEPSIYRTIFVGEDDSVVVLIDAQSEA